MRFLNVNFAARAQRQGHGHPARGPVSVGETSPPVAVQRQTTQQGWSQGKIDLV